MEPARSATFGYAAAAAAAVLLVAAFVASRIALIATSYDVLANWEEPAFLYSAQELARTGFAHIFDHQDDLNHGGSLALLVPARLWVALFGPSLVLLKGVALLWSAATLIALVAVGWRFVSPRYGLLLGLAYAALSPAAAALQVTLVGSHPESVLFAALALGAYWRTLEPGAGARPAFALGLFAGLASWCSYAAAPLAGSLVLAALIRRRFAGMLVCGVVGGAAPWIVQNLWLRPHGALQWLDRLDRFAAAQAAGSTEACVFLHVADSFGLGRVPGVALMATLLVLGGLAVIRCVFLRDMRQVPALAAAPPAVVPLAAGALLGFLALAIAKPQAMPGEAWYAYRYYIPLHTTLYALAFLGVESQPARRRTVAALAACALMIAAAVYGQAPLYAKGNTYRADPRRDLLAGCSVFGHGELDRAGNITDATQRLARIPDAECRQRAFVGLGWALVGRYAHDGDAPALAASIEAIEDHDLRAATCQGARQLMATFYEGAMTADRRRTGALFLEHACRGVENGNPY